MNNSELLWQEAYNLVPRVLGLMDRDPNSYTYGCADRYYWHYKLHDFANARLQDAGWLLALIYRANVKGNRFFKKRKVVKWAFACMEWWMKTQHKNGAFDEVYPYEYSFCASAFSTWWIAETFLELKRVDADEPKMDKIINVYKETEIIERLEKAGRWLMRNSNIKVGNQQAAAIAALGALYSITHKDEYLFNAKKKLDELINVQDRSGFYPEYGGPDVGYHSLTLTCLFSYKKHFEEDEPLLDKSLIKGIDFLKNKISENGNYNWWETSRRTQYLYSYSLLASKTITGQGVFERFLKGLNNNLVLRPSWIDDRYCTFFAIDLLRTFLLLKSEK